MRAAGRRGVRSDSTPLVTAFPIRATRLGGRAIHRRGPQVHPGLSAGLPGGCPSSRDHRGGSADVGAAGLMVFGRGGSAAVRVIEAGLRRDGDQMIAAGLVDR